MESWAFFPGYIAIDICKYFDAEPWANESVIKEHSGIFTNMKKVYGSESERPLDHLV